MFCLHAVNNVERHPQHGGDMLQVLQHDSMNFRQCYAIQCPILSVGRNCPFLPARCSQHKRKQNRYAHPGAQPRSTLASMIDWCNDVELTEGSGVTASLPATGSVQVCALFCGEPPAMIGYHPWGRSARGRAQTAPISVSASVETDACYAKPA